MCFLSSFLRPASVVGFSGSRVSSPELAAAFDQAAAFVSGSVFVGCAAGVDELARLRFPAARVFHVSASIPGRSRFAVRSIGFVRSVAAAGGVLVSLPRPGSLPVSGLVPSASAGRCFSGGGSGSWASLAFAVGQSVPCVVFLGSSRPPVGWGLRPVPSAPGWFFRRPGGVQLSLF